MHIAKKRKEDDEQGDEETCRFFSLSSCGSVVASSPSTHFIHHIHIGPIFYAHYTHFISKDVRVLSVGLTYTQKRIRGSLFLSRSLSVLCSVTEHLACKMHFRAACVEAPRGACARSFPARSDGCESKEFASMHHAPTLESAAETCEKVFASSSSGRNGRWALHTECPLCCR